MTISLATRNFFQSTSEETDINVSARMICALVKPDPEDAEDFDHLKLDASRSEHPPPRNLFDRILLGIPGPDQSATHFLKKMTHQLDAAPSLFPTAVRMIYVLYRSAKWNPSERPVDTEFIRAVYRAPKLYSRFIKLALQTEQEYAPGPLQKDQISEDGTLGSLMMTFHTIHLATRCINDTVRLNRPGECKDVVETWVRADVFQLLEAAMIRCEVFAEGPSM